MNIKRQDWKLFLLSVIALFLELAIIRWLSSEIRIFAYFKNLPLMAAFLFFGVGFLLARGGRAYLVSRLPGPTRYQIRDTRYGPPRPLDSPSPSR